MASGTITILTDYKPERSGIATAPRFHWETETALIETGMNPEEDSGQYLLRNLSADSFPVPRTNRELELRPWHAVEAFLAAWPVQTVPSAWGLVADVPKGTPDPSYFSWQNPHITVMYVNKKKVRGDYDYIRNYTGNDVHIRISHKKWDRLYRQYVYPSTEIIVLAPGEGCVLSGSRVIDTGVPGWAVPEQNSQGHVA